MTRKEALGLKWMVWVVLLGLIGCKDKPQFPTEKAPPTLKNLPSKSSDVDENDDEEDDEEDGAGVGALRRRVGGELFSRAFR